MKKYRIAVIVCQGVFGIEKQGLAIPVGKAGGAAFISNLLKYLNVLNEYVVYHHPFPPGSEHTSTRSRATPEC